jgi:hypothetical protein
MLERRACYNAPYLLQPGANYPRLSLLEFKAIQYRRKGNAIATDEQLARIAKVPKREFMRRDMNQHTLEKICRREPVRAIKLAICLRILEDERGQ